MIRHWFIALAASAVAAGVAAADFDGSRKLICAPVTAMDCAKGVACASGTPGEMGAPSFIRVDVGNKTVSGAERTAAVQHVEKTAEQLLLQGLDIGQAWAIAIDANDGRMFATLTARDGAIVMIGSCTPL